MTSVFNSSIKHSVSKRRQLTIGLLALLITFAMSERAHAGLGDKVNLGIQLAASPKFPKAMDVGKLYPIRFNASNQGPVAATNATITITLPNGMTASGLPAGCSAISSTVITCTDNSFAKDEKLAVSFKLKASEAAIGNGSIVANIGSDDTDTQPTNNAVTTAVSIGSVVEVSVSKSGDENATIVDNGELDCGTTCQTTIKSNKASGNKITLQAVPGFRNKLIKWTGTTCKAKPPFKCTIKTKPGKKYTIGAVFGQAADEKVVLLLHGMNSDTSTWKDFVKKNFKSCNSVDNGVIIGAINKKSAVHCYAVRFGAYDAKGDNGLEDAKQWATDNNIRKAGDFSTFDQLGKEVDKAVGAIKSYHPGAHLLLIGHSRGGLAARAFLSNQSITNEPLNSLWTNYVDGLITTGSPHNGSPIGKTYSWLKNHPRDNCSFFDDCNQDWLAVDQLGFLLKTAGLGLDARRPAIGYLAPASAQILKLNDGSVSASIVTGQIRYGGLPLGLLSDSYDIFSSDRSGGKSTLLSITLTDPAVDFLIGKGVNADSKNLLGDGIVPLANQSYKDAYVDKTYLNNKVLHTDEPKRVADINSMICKLTSPLIPSVKFDNWVKCP